MNVFISYAREDRDRAHKLAGALEARGWSVWWDPKIQAGQSFDETIERELETADCVVVLWSEHSIVSEWVKNEASAALARGVLIPARIDDIKLPLEFRRRQAAELVGWNGEPSHAGFRALGDAIARMVVSPAAAAPADNGSGSAPAQIARNRTRLVSGIAGVAVLLALGYYAGSRVGASYESAREPKAPASPTPSQGLAQGPRDPASTAAAGLSAAPGIFDFKWPGDDCWKVYRGEVVAKSGCGGGKHSLQAGTYVIKPSSSGVFEPLTFVLEPGATVSADADAGIFDFKWPGDDCWKVYRGEVVAKSGCGGGKHSLQAGTYVVKPSSSAVFEPFSVRILRGQTNSTPSR
jgi:hypothetical protein